MKRILNDRPLYCLVDGTGEAWWQTIRISRSKCWECSTQGSPGYRKTLYRKGYRVVKVNIVAVKGGSI